MLKVGLVGVGGISGAHIPAWNAIAETELVALCDIRSSQMEQYPQQRHYTDFAEMLQKEELDILDICLPTYLHVDYAVMAMEKGIHVICEKPIALKAEDATRAYAAAEKNGVQFMVAQVLRFWPEYMFLKELVDSRRYGKVLSGYMQRLGVKPKWSWDNWMMDPVRSGMVPFDLHIHDLDFLVYTLGKPEVEHIFHGMDYMHTIYRYGDIRIACESAWFHAPVPFQATFRMQFEKAVLEFTGGALKIFKEDWTTSTLDMASSVEEGNYIPQSDGYYNELRYFIDCVKEGKKPEIVKPHELETVLDTIAIINAVK